MIIETDKLCKRYANVHAVTDLNLNVPEGSVYALFGPNAAGKTTTLKMLMNLVRPTSGVARVLGCPSRRLGPSEFQRIAYVSENQPLPEAMTVRGMLDFCRTMYPGWDEAFLGELLTRLALDPGARIGALSRGTRMKVAFASSLAYHPSLMLLDEPFAGLDPAVRSDVVEGLLSRAGGGNFSAIIATHDMDEIERIVDRVGILDCGRLVLDESVDSLLGRFRRVVARVGAAPLSAPLPHWLGVENHPPMLSFVESRFDADLLGERVRAVFPDAEHIDAVPMTFKEIFIAITQPLIRSHPS
jgi:ABC-2 type transport system ATP-binding protein